MSHSSLWSLYYDKVIKYLQNEWTGFPSVFFNSIGTNLKKSHLIGEYDKDEQEI